MGEALAAHGHKVAIAVMDCPENRQRMLLEAPHCEPIWCRSGLLREIADKIKMAWRWRPDVLYSTSYSLHNLAGFRWVLPWKMKCVVEFCELYSYYPVRRLNWAVWETLALFEYHYVLCASKFLLDHFSCACKRLKLRRSLEYLPYAYPSYLFSAPIESAKRKHIVFMAAMSRGYGAFLVLEAFENLLRVRNDVVLVMIGGGPDLAEMRQWVSDRGLEQSVLLCGYVAEDLLNGYFSSASVFVSPMHETIQDKARCPSKLFYYLPYNKPIVTCRIGNPADVLGNYGFYYRSQDPDDMARAFDCALTASETFSYPEGFVEKHSWNARAERFEKWIWHE